MIDARYAEEANYFSTTVSLSKSQAEIMEMLEGFGVTDVQLTQGRAGGQMAWMVRFVWQWTSQPATFRFVFTPLGCREPSKVRSFGGKRRTHEAQAVLQMGRIARHLVKAVLTAAEVHPYALFGFMEIPGIKVQQETLGDVPPTAGELGVDGLIAGLPEIRVGPEAFFLPPSRKEAGGSGATEEDGD